MLPPMYPWRAVRHGAGRIKTKELGTFRKDPGYSVRSVRLQDTNSQDGKGLQVFFPRGFLLYIDSEILPHELYKESSIGVRNYQSINQSINT
jgi:hypothetical protein